jgi:hypothetical protein
MLKKVVKNNKSIKIDYQIDGESCTLYAMSEGVAKEYVKQLLKVGFVTYISVSKGNTTKVVRRAS